MDNNLLKNTIATIIEIIEVWDNSLSSLFSDCLVKIIENLIDKINTEQRESKYTNSIFYNDFINMILNFYICVVENNDNDMTIYYLRSFNDIIETLNTKYKKVIVDNDIIQKASSMGSFGKKNNLRRYSLFFCTCLIRVKILIETLLNQFIR